MAGQIIVIPALALSFFTGNWFVGLALGLTAFLIPQIAWCCAMNKCGFITGGVFGIIAAGALVAFGVLIMIIIQTVEDACDAGFFNLPDCSTLTSCTDSTYGNYYCDGCDCTDYATDFALCYDNSYNDNPDCSTLTSCTDSDFGTYYCDGCDCTESYDYFFNAVDCNARRLIQGTRNLQLDADCLSQQDGYDADTWDSLNLWIILSFVGAALWFIGSIFIFSFACCSRYDAAVEKLKEAQGEPSAVATPVSEAK